METLRKYTRPKTNSSHLKMNGPEDEFLFASWPIFRGYVSFREGRLSGVGDGISSNFNDSIVKTFGPHDFK